MSRCWRDRFLSVALSAFVCASAGLLPGCDRDADSPAPRAIDSIRVEDARWEPLDGRNRHDFTLVRVRYEVVKVRTTLGGKRRF